MSEVEETKPLAISVPEAAVVAGISRSTAFKFVASGDLPSLKVGRRRLVLVSEIQSWLERKQAEQAGK